MRRLVLMIAVSCIVPAARLSADAVTTDDQLTVYGTVLRLDDKEVKLRARFASETKEISVPRSRVVEIEINDETYNSGAPPALGARPAAASPAAARPAGPRDKVFFRGGASMDCDRVTFDGTRLTCGAETFGRRELFQIKLGAQ